MDTKHLWLATTYDGSEPLRLSAFLHHRAGISTTLLRKLKQADAINVNGQPARVSQLLKPGDLVELEALPEEPGLPSEEMSLDIVYQDEYLLAVNKIAGMVVHPVKHYTSGTLANGLAHHLSRESVSRKVRLMHRLDKDTSGLVLVSLNPVVHYHLVQMLQGHSIRKTYFALITGKLEGSGTIDAPINREEPDSVRHHVDPGGKRAITHYKSLKTWDDKASFVEIDLETGRTHQIRVHFSHLGHPLMGDQIYGTPNMREPINRQALHAAKLQFSHPVTGNPLILEAPLPEDMNRVIKLYDRFAELGL